LLASDSCPPLQKTLNVYATATLSGDVSNALALLKRMTRPALRRQKNGLLIPFKELAASQVGVPFRPPCRRLHRMVKARVQHMHQAGIFAL
jgi:hypothetical protein